VAEIGESLTVNQNECLDVDVEELENVPPKKYKIEDLEARSSFFSPPPTPNLRKKVRIMV
jgi:hypothetical protein